MERVEIEALVESGKAEMHAMNTRQITDTLNLREQALQRIKDGKELLSAYGYA